MTLQQLCPSSFLQEKRCRKKDVINGESFPSTSTPTYPRKIFRQMEIFFLEPSFDGTSRTRCFLARQVDMHSVVEWLIKRDLGSLSSNDSMLTAIRYTTAPLLQNRISAFCPF